MEKFQTEPITTEEKPEESRPDSVPGTVIDDKSYSQLYSYFNIDTKEGENPKVQNAVKTIFDYAKNESENKSIEDILWRVRALETKIGTPEFGVKRYEKLYRYIVLLDEENQLRRRREAHERV